MLLRRGDFPVSPSIPHHTLYINFHILFINRRHYCRPQPRSHQSHYPFKYCQPNVDRNRLLHCDRQEASWQHVYITSFFFIDQSTHEFVPDLVFPIDIS